MPLEPELPEVFDEHRKAILGELHIAMPGRVQSYDASKQVADVIPCIRGTIPDGDGNTLLEDRPVIPNVPIQWPSGGGFYLHFPLKKDDHVWLVFNSDAIAQWRATGEVSAPGDLRKGTLSYPFAIPGAKPDKQAFTDAPAEDEAVIIIPDGGHLRVSKAGGSGAAHFVSLDSLVVAQLNALKDAISGAAVAAGDGGASFKSAIIAALSSWPASTAATSLKSD